MKKNKATKKKLTLNLETVRALAGSCSACDPDLSGNNHTQDIETCTWCRPIY